MKEDILNFGFFRLARNESLKTNHRIKVGAVLVRHGKPISVGRNIPNKSHALIRRYSRFQMIHAEIDCMVGIDRHLLNGSTMYVYREHSDGTVAMSKPCPICEMFLRNYGVKKVFYTVENNFKMMRI